MGEDVERYLELAARIDKVDTQAYAYQVPVVLKEVNDDCLFGSGC